MGIGVVRLARSLKVGGVKACREMKKKEQSKRASVMYRNAFSLLAFFFSGGRFRLWTGAFWWFIVRSAVPFLLALLLLVWCVRSLLKNGWNLICPSLWILIRLKGQNGCFFVSRCLTQKHPVACGRKPPTCFRFIGIDIYKTLLGKEGEEPKPTFCCPWNSRLLFSLFPPSFPRPPQ